MSPPSDSDSGRLQGPSFQSVTTPVNVPLLEKLLAGFSHAKEVVDGFRHGFKFHFAGTECAITSKNSIEASTNPSAVDAKIKKEMDRGRIAGPFDDPPFEDFKCSPLSLREKSEPGTYRLLHNLSYPYDVTSVNGGIEQQHKTVKYATVQSAIKIINKLGKGCFMAKADIESAYRIVPIHPSQFHLLGFRWKGKYYYDKYLPMGLAESCAIFEMVSDSIVHIMENMGVTNVVKVLDDFLLLAPSKAECDLALQKFKFICHKLEVPLVAEKTSVASGQEIVFLGVKLETRTMRASLPQDKLRRYHQDLEQFRQIDSTKLRSLQSLIGKLQFATSVIPIGKPFLRRLIDATKGHSVQAEITVNQDMRADIAMWSIFLKNFNGTSVITKFNVCDSSAMNLFSDASNAGFAGTFGSRWIQGSWNPKWQSLNIAVRELYPIVAIMGMFGHLCQNQSLIFQCDNQAIVAVINKQSSKNPTIMKLLRPLILNLMLNNIKFKAVYITSEDNVLADAISRFQEDAQLLKNYGMKDSPTQVPHHLRPEQMIQDD